MAEAIPLSLFVAQPAPQIAFTFDDLPAHGSLPPGETRVEVATKTIAALHAAHVPDVYGFVNAADIEKNPSDANVLKAWRAAGFPLGNHGWSHMNLNQHTVGEWEADVLRNEAAIAPLMQGEDWRWFRYPYLWEGDTLEKRHAVRQYLKAHKYRVAQVTLDFEDYLWNGPYARCAEKNDAGSIEWLKASYMTTAAKYIALDRQMAKLVYGRDIRHVLISGFPESTS